MRILPGTLGSLAAIAAFATLSALVYAGGTQDVDNAMAPFAANLILQLYVYPAGATTLVLAFLAVGTPLRPRRSRAPASAASATPPNGPRKCRMAMLGRWVRGAGLSVALGGGTLIAVLMIAAKYPWYGPVVIHALGTYTTTLPALLLGSALYLTGAFLGAISRRGRPPAPPNVSGRAPELRREPIAPTHRA